MSQPTSQPQDEDRSPLAAEGTGPDETELDPAKTGADHSDDDERSDAG